MNIPSKIKAFVYVLTLVTAFLVTSGYLLSDDRYFADIIKTNSIDSPAKAFDFVKRNTEFVTGNPTPEMYCTPRYMLEKKRLWCDESAMVLATIVDRIGYQTRLIDVIKADGIAGHTYLQIYEDGEWKNYDTVLKKSGISHEEILAGFAYADLKGFSREREYPRLYNRLIQNNFYFKHLMLWLRNAAG